LTCATHISAAVTVVIIGQEISTERLPRIWVGANPRPFTHIALYALIIAAEVIWSRADFSTLSTIVYITRCFHTFLSTSNCPYRTTFPFHARWRIANIITVSAIFPVILEVAAILEASA
jgi:hypothetical protein